jgi:hypothetical protein
MTELLINYVQLCFIVKEFNKHGQCAKVEETETEEIISPK